MAIAKTEISEESRINSRTEEDEITQQEAASNYQLGIGLTSSSDTPNPPPSKATLDRNIIIETASPDASSPVTYTPESSVEPTIKRDNLCSITRENLLSLPPVPQEYQGNVANWAMEDQSIYTGEGTGVRNCSGEDMIQLADDDSKTYENEIRNSSNLLRDYQEQLHRLGERNKKEKLDREGWKSENINLNEYSKSLHSAEEKKDFIGCYVAGKLNEDVETKHDKFTAAKEASMEEDFEINRASETLFSHEFGRFTNKVSATFDDSTSRYHQEAGQHQEEVKTKAEMLSKTQSGLFGITTRSKHQTPEGSSSPFTNYMLGDHEKKLALLNKQNSERLMTTQQGKDTFIFSQPSNTASPSESHLYPLPSCNKHYDELRRHHMQLILQDEQKKMKENMSSIQPEESRSQAKDKAQRQGNQLCVRTLFSGSRNTLENNKAQLMYVEQANNENLASAHLRPEEISKPKTVDSHESHDSGMVKRESLRGFTPEGYPYMWSHEEEKKEHSSALSQKEAAQSLRFKAISEIPASQQPPHRSQNIPTQDPEPSSEGFHRRDKKKKSTQKHEGKSIQKILPKPMPPPQTESRFYEINDASAPDATFSSQFRLQDYQMQLMLLEQQNKKRLMMARMEMDEGNGSSKRVKVEEKAMN